MSMKKKRLIACCGIAALIVLWLVLFWIIGKPMLRFIRQPEVFRAWMQERGFFGMLLFTAMIVLQVVVAIIPGEPLELVAGYAFGTVLGTVLCMIGFLIGSWIIFALVQKFRKQVLLLFFSEEKLQTLRFLKNSPKRNALIFLLMLLPGTPKDLISYFVGLTDMRLRTWLLIVAITRIPSLITSTVGGDALGVQNYTFALIVFGITAAISAAGYLIYCFICKKHEEKDSAPTE